MREILGIAAEWARAETPFAIATLVAVTGSGPRELGASMIVSASGGVFGNVSGGCVEGAVFTECLDAVSSGASSLHTYGIRDGDVAAIGLTCGGVVEVAVIPVLPGTAAARAVLLAAERERAGLPVGIGVVTRSAGRVAGELVVLAPEGAGEAPGGVAGPTEAGASIAAEPWGRAVTEAEALVCGERAEALHLDANGCRVPVRDAALSMLVVPFGAPPRLIVVGAVEFSVALARLGSALGFAVTIVDPRDVFASTARFPGADVVIAWPDRYLAQTRIDARTAICVLSHDERFDVPALSVALASGAAYVGAMGSRRTHEDRLERLAAAGVAASAVARLRSPIGLDLGGRTADETALSILAEIVALRHGGTGRPHSELAGPLHAPAVPAGAPAAAPAPVVHVSATSAPSGGAPASARAAAP